MARQTTTPVSFNRTSRGDKTVTMSSGYAGVVKPLGYVPVLRGESAAGRVTFDVELAEMPKPLLNGVIVNVQAWFVPKDCHPQFSSHNEFMNSYQGTKIKALGQAERDAPAFYNHVVASGTGEYTELDQSDFFRDMGIHLPPAGASVQTDLVDAFNLIYNFRLAAHSSKLALRQFASEDLTTALTYPPAFWPSSHFSNMVPDYEKALILGQLDLDVYAGQLPLSGLGRSSNDTDGSSISDPYTGDTIDNNVASWKKLVTSNNADPKGVWAEMAGNSVTVTLQDIDKARQTQAFAKLRTAYAGANHTEYMSDDAIVAELMQGLSVDGEEFRRPWLLDSRRVPVGFAERHATDAPNLDVSVSQGVASATLSMNLPVQNTGGVIIYTLELLPERITERESDEWLHKVTPFDLPDALRDIQRVEPVDMVLSRRIDARHTTPDALYGYEPMNDVWNRVRTRLGGQFYQADPSNPFKESRSALWMTSIVDPTFSDDHYLAPVPFPHDVFSDTLAPAYECVVRHDLTLVGLTQFGDVLAEDNNEYTDTATDGGQPDPNAPVAP